MKFIFQIGFGKCATQTIADFFRGNGIRSVHWDSGKLAQRMHANGRNGKPLLTGYEKYQCFTDMEYLSMKVHIEGFRYFDTLAKQYPDSVFILNKRPVKSWIESRLAWRDGYVMRCYANVYGLPPEPKIIAKHWQQDWYAHFDAVRQAFKDDKRLIEFPILQGPGVLIKALPEFHLDARHWHHKHPRVAQLGSRPGS